MYLHRFLRLTPVLGLAILVYMKVLPLMGSGPVFRGFSKAISSTCDKYWFWTILYVQNYVVPDEIVGSNLTGPICNITYLYICLHSTDAVFGPQLVPERGHAALHHLSYPTDRTLQVGQEGGGRYCGVHIAPGCLPFQRDDDQGIHLVSNSLSYL